MKPEIKNKWIKALKSGKYKQGTNTLKTIDGKYCCLGVLCKLYGQEKGVNWRKRGTSNYFLDECSYLPSAVQEWAGLTDNNPKAGDNVLSLLNDKEKYDFGKIADEIEKTL